MFTGWIFCSYVKSPEGSFEALVFDIGDRGAKDQSEQRSSKFHPADGGAAWRRASPNRLKL